MDSIPTIDFNGLVRERVRLPQERTPGLKKRWGIACAVLESSIIRGSPKGCTLPSIEFTCSASHAIPRRRVNEQNTQEPTCSNNNNKVISFWLIKIKRTSLTWSSVFEIVIWFQFAFETNIILNLKLKKPKAKKGKEINSLRLPRTREFFTFSYTQIDRTNGKCNQ